MFLTFYIFKRKPKKQLMSCNGKEGVLWHWKIGSMWSTKAVELVCYRRKSQCQFFNAVYQIKQAFCSPPVPTASDFRIAIFWSQRNNYWTSLLMAAGLEWKCPKCAIIKDCKGCKLFREQRKQNKFARMGKWTPSMGSQNLSSKLMYSVNSQGSPKGEVGGNHNNPNFCSCFFFLCRNYYPVLVTTTEFKVLESSNGLETSMCQLLQKAL